MDENLRKLAEATNWLNTNKTRENTDKIVEELKKLNQTQKDIRRGKRCPHCKGVVTTGAQICMHCNNPLVWIKGLVCKPGGEARLQHEIKVYEKSIRDLKPKPKTADQKAAYIEQMKPHWEKRSKERKERKAAEAKENINIFLYIVGCFIGVPVIVGIILYIFIHFFG